MTMKKRLKRLLHPWNKLVLDARTYHCLKKGMLRYGNGDIKYLQAVTVGDLAKMSDRELMRLKDFGRTSLGVLRTAIAAYTI